LGRRDKIKIPIDQTDLGITLCLENARQFCSDADVLVKHDSYDHALGLCILATEELGKAIMLKEQSALAKKRSEDFVIFRKIKLDGYFKAIPEELQIRFKRTTNPFLDHFSKLFAARNMLSLSSHERSMLSLEGEWFTTIEEMWEKTYELMKQTIEPDVDLRNLAFYVDYDETKGSWSKGMRKIDPVKMQGFISDIRKSINLIDQNTKEKE
jgi:AbiV family abortive infection protein